MVEEKIKQVVDSIDGLNYMFNDWTTANIELDKQPFPVCLNVLPVAGQLHMHNGIFRDYPHCLIAFLDKAEIDPDNSENELVVNRMKNYAMEFLVAVNKSGLFKEIPEYFPYSVVYDYLDQQVTGVVLQIQLKELQGVCVR